VDRADVPPQLHLYGHGLGHHITGGLTQIGRVCVITSTRRSLCHPVKECYASGVAVPIHRKITRWIIDHLFWDTTGTAREGLWGGLWATRKLLVAVAGAALLTWREWVKHHPPEIAIVAVMHFAFVLPAVGLVVRIGQWFSRSDKRSADRRPVSGGKNSA
jgi:hypothetical protein